MATAHAQLADLRRELIASGACPFEIAALAMQRADRYERLLQQLQTQLQQQAQHQRRHLRVAA